MTSVFNEKMTSKSVVQSPKDEILKGVIVNIEKGLLSEFLDEKVHSKFDNLDQPTLKIDYEVKFNDKTLKGNDKFPYFSEPMSNFKLGKFLTKYSELSVGTEIKVIYNGKGFGKIQLD